MKHERSPKGWYLLWLLMLAAVLWAEKLPSAGEQCIIRAAAVQADGTCTVGLLYQQPSEAADSAQAQEQMRMAWGEGETLAAACACAEEKLPSRAVYKLCDTVLLCGGQPLAAMRLMQRQVETDGCGRLAARVAVWQGDAAGLRRCTAEGQGAAALADALETLRAQAPRLYQAQEPGLVLPVLAESGEGQLLHDGALYLVSDKRIHLSDVGEEIALLLRDGHARLMLELPSGRRAVVHAVTSLEVKAPDHAALTVTAVAYNVPDAADRAQLETMLQQDCLAVWQLTDTGAADLPGTQAMLALRCGGSFPSAAQRECRVRLWTLE